MCNIIMEFSAVIQNLLHDYIDNSSLSCQKQSMQPSATHSKGQLWRLAGISFIFSFAYLTSKLHSPEILPHPRHIPTQNVTEWLTMHAIKYFLPAIFYLKITHFDRESASNSEYFTLTACSLGILHLYLQVVFKHVNCIYICRLPLNM